MKLQEHCKHAKETFGEEFDYVHKWLDEFANVKDKNGKTKFNAYHRQHRHHLAGAEEVRAKWGDKAYEAAIQHIRDDLMSGECLRESEPLPKDEKDYVRKGFF